LVAHSLARQLIAEVSELRIAGDLACFFSRSRDISANIAPEAKRRRRLSFTSN
jgi:hypothetical protein